MGVFVDLHDDFFRGIYGFETRTRFLGKPVQTAVKLSAPVSPHLCVAIWGGRFQGFFQDAEVLFHCIVALAFMNQGHNVEGVKLESEPRTSLG